MPYAINKGVKIHYDVEGHGPPFMLVHGFGGPLDSWRSWGYTLDLDKDHELILIDVRGCGSSDKPHDVSAYSFQTLVSDLIAVLDELGIEKSDNIGYSMGGRIGFRIPLFAAFRFNSLVIGGAAYPIVGTEDSDDDLPTGIHLALEKSVEEARQNPMAFFLAALERRLGAPIPPGRRDAYLADDAAALLASARAFRGAVSAPAEEVLPKITLPTMLIIGEKDARFPAARECAVRIPGPGLCRYPALTICSPLHARTCFCRMSEDTWPKSESTMPRLEDKAIQSGRQSRSR